MFFLVFFLYKKEMLFFSRDAKEEKGSFFLFLVLFLVVFLFFYFFVAFYGRFQTVVIDQS